jgi:hypothetical protein
MLSWLGKIVRSYKVVIDGFELRVYVVKNFEEERIEMCRLGTLVALEKNMAYFGMHESRLMRAGTAKCIVLACQHDNPSGEGDLFAPESLWVSFPIPVLMMRERNFLIPSDFVVHSFRPPMEEAMSRLWSQWG